jgi:hypothetical protein
MAAPVLKFEIRKQKNRLGGLLALLEASGLLEITAAGKQFAGNAMWAGQLLGDWAGDDFRLIQAIATSETAHIPTASGNLFLWCCHNFLIS